MSFRNVVRRIWKLSSCERVGWCTLVPTPRLMGRKKERKKERKKDTLFPSCRVYATAHKINWICHHYSEYRSRQRNERERVKKLYFQLNVITNIGAARQLPSCRKHRSCTKILLPVLWDSVVPKTRLNNLPCQPFHNFRASESVNP